jgi:hypothetical protein
MEKVGEYQIRRECVDLCVCVGMLEACTADFCVCECYIICARSSVSS